MKLRGSYTLRTLYAQLPGIGPGWGVRWNYPLIVELDGAKPEDPDGLAQRGEAVCLDFDDQRGIAILKVET
jgi:hypothetical protein